MRRQARSGRPHGPGRRGRSPNRKSRSFGPQISSCRYCPGPRPSTPADQFAGQVAVELRGLAVRRARLPLRFLGGQQAAHLIPVVENAPVGAGYRQRHDPGLVRQHVPHRGRRPELRPVPLHGRVQVQPPLPGQVQHAHRGERLADRVRLDDAGGLPRPGPGPRRRSRPTGQRPTAGRTTRRTTQPRSRPARRAPRPGSPAPNRTAAP